MMGSYLTLPSAGSLVAARWSLPAGRVKECLLSNDLDALKVSDYRLMIND